MAAWDVVSKKPLEFIKNTVRSIGHGFQLLWDNIWDHLKYGLQGWLFGELTEKKHHPAHELDRPEAVFSFVLDVLGLSVDHVCELLAKQFDADKVAAKVRKWFGQVDGAIEWINKAIDATKSPTENAQGIWDQAKSFGASILTGIAEWVAGKVAEELAIMAAAAAASAAFRGRSTSPAHLQGDPDRGALGAPHPRHGQQGLDNVLDIAAGAVEKVGEQVRGRSCRWACRS